MLNADAPEALRVETEFLAGVEANLEQAKGKQLRGDRWQMVRDDDGDAVRAMMAMRRVYDRELLKQLPHNRRIVLHGSERRWLLFRRQTGMALATVIAPLEHLLTPDSPQAPPVTLGQLTDRVRKLVGGAKVPCVVGVCSPSGFTTEALESRPDLSNVVLVLVSPRAGGGWNVTTPAGNVPESIRNLFDPEAASQKLARVRKDIEEHSVELLTGGLSGQAVAERTGLPETLIAQAFKQVAGQDPELRASRRAGDVLLYRGAPARMREGNPMNVVDRIKQLFSREGEEAQKINLLSERRAGLAQRRDRLYEDIGKLEKREADLLTQGRATQSKVSRRRLAAQLAQLRKDIARQNTTANMLNQQINILSTDIHNLTLIQQGQLASLPNTEELTQNAVKAEEMLETLKADADLVTGLETGIADVATSDEELAILREFEQPERAAEIAPDEPEEITEAMADFEEPAPQKKEKDKADPEA